MKATFNERSIKIFALCALIVQALLTLNHIKFFPFSDHGIFELPRKLQGQKLYRIITKESQPHYQEEGILFEVTNEIQNLIEYGRINPKEINQYLDKKVIAIDRYTMGKTSTPPLFVKERIFEN